MELKKIAILNNSNEIIFNDKHLSKLSAAAPDSEVILYQTAEELLYKALDADALIYWPFRASLVEDFYKKAPNLKWVHVFTAGVDSLKDSALRERDTMLSCTKGIHGLPIAEHVLALALAMMRRLPQAFAAQKEHTWRKSIATEYQEIYQKTLGVIGVGMIGREVVKKAKACGFRVIGADAFPVVVPELETLYPIERLDEMLAECDFVVLNCPLIDSTYHLINDARLKAMKPEAFLINVARGSIVDDGALIDALREKEIGGAALDAFAVEPLPEDSPYWDLDNVIITPHVAAYSTQYMDRAVGVISDNILSLLDNKPLKFEINLQTL